ncbi:MAG TPA: sigma 54-interacting transcriptional regulator, partial [Gemmatimonadales bacterium]
MPADGSTLCAQGAPRPAPLTPPRRTRRRPFLDRASLETELLGPSETMHRVRATIARLADLPWPVRVVGPSGAGKGVAARLLHTLSVRAQGPFVARPLNMLTDDLALAELVGHARGAFTGALTDRSGAFEAAHGGTLFLDEIALASPRVQEHLLQLVEEREVRRLGEHRSRRVNVRLVVATNASLERKVLEGVFREDLFLRLGEFVVAMPALRDRASDIPWLAEHIIARLAREAEVEPGALGPCELKTLRGYSWPGNVRELINVLQYFIVYGCLPEGLYREAQGKDWRDRVAEALEHSR